MIRRYRVTNMAATASAETATREVLAYDAADAVAQEMLRLKDYHPPRRVVSVDPAADAVEAPKTAEPAFVWRGDAEAFVAELAQRLSVEELARLSGEVALGWRWKRMKQMEQHTDDCSTGLGQPCDCKGEL